MPFQVIRQSDFSQGVFASATRFVAPRNSILRGSNLIGTKRGGLRTVDGSSVVSQDTTTPGPIVFISTYNPNTPTAPPKRIAIRLDSNTSPQNLSFWDASGPTMVQFYLLSGAQGLSQTPNMVQLLGNLFIAPGLGQPALLSMATAGSTENIVNNFNGTDNYASIERVQTYQSGEAATAVGSDGNTYLYQAIQAGLTQNAPAPTFPILPNSTVVDGSVVWSFIAINSPPFPPGAAFVFYHLGFPWIWGTASIFTSSGIHGPDGIAMGNLGDANTWNPLFTAFIGKNDGQAAMGGSVLTLAESGIPATAQLVLFKSQSTYSVLGAFPNIQIQQVPLGMGCAAPNSVQVVPDVGIVRLSYWGVTVFNGQSDEASAFTDPIRPYLFGGEDDIAPIDWTNAILSASFQTTNPPGYGLICPVSGDPRNPGLSRVFFYDTVLKAWYVLDLPWAIASGAFLTQTSFPSPPLLGGAVDGTIRQIFNGDATWDQGPTTAPLDIPWYFRTPGHGSTSDPMFFRRINMRARASSKNYKQPILSSASWQSKLRDGTDIKQGLLTNGRGPVTQSVTVGVTALGGAQFDLGGSGQVTIEGLDVQVMPKAPSRVGE